MQRRLLFPGVTFPEPDHSNPEKIVDKFMWRFKPTRWNLLFSKEPAAGLVAYLTAFSDCNAGRRIDSMLSQTDPVAVTNQFLDTFEVIKPHHIFKESKTSLLHVACKMGANAPGVLNALLNHGVKPDPKPERLKQRETLVGCYFGFWNPKLTPLQTAALFAPPECTRLLLAAGAPVTGYADKELSPLGIARLRQMQDATPAGQAAGRDVALALTSAGMQLTSADRRSIAQATRAAPPTFSPYVGSRFGVGADAGPYSRQKVLATAAKYSAAAPQAGLVPHIPIALPGEDSRTSAGRPAAGERTASRAGPAPAATEQTALLDQGAGPASDGYGTARPRADWRTFVDPRKASPGEGPASASGTGSVRPSGGGRAQQGL